MEVQKYLQGHTLKDLELEYGIKVKEYEDIVCLNYDQIKSKKTDPITIECRALKLYKENWTVASRAFDRFFNFGESEAKNFSFETSVIAEKVDGSLIPVWFNKVDKKWHISTRGSGFAEGKGNGDKSFNEMVLITFPNLLQIMENEDPDYTFLFEFISPENRIVTPYEKSELVLLGIRHNLSGNYKTLVEMEDFVHRCSSSSVRMCKFFHFDSLNKAVEFTSSFKRLEEGFVCWDLKSDLRIKIKSVQYVAMHLMCGKIDDESILSVILQGETDEFISYYPELREKFRECERRISLFQEFLSKTYAEICHLPQKDFAIVVTSNFKLYSSLFFSARKFGNMQLSFANLTVPRKIEFLKNFRQI